MRSPRLLHGIALLVSASLAMALLHGCQDAPQPTEIEPAAAAALRTLTVTGAGTGDGVVTSSPAGINCTMTAATAAATGCKAQYSNGVVVTLTATPKSGNSFKTWSNACTGTGTCKVTMTANKTVRAKFLKSSSSSAATMGKWAAAFSTPVVAVDLSLLPTGKVLLWGDQGDAQVWDPANPGAGFTPVSKTYRIFCSGHTFLPDGRLLVTGGVVHGTIGDPRAVLFDPVSNSWIGAGPMAEGRYYPTSTALPNGEILAVSGNDENGNVVAIPEIWNGSTWRKLSGASLAIPAPFYPAMFLAPNGKVFLAGFPQTSRYLDVTVTGGAWTTVGNRMVADRRMGSAVMYAAGKILYAGGGDPPTSSAEVIDLNQVSPAWRSVSGMHFARRQLNATILADGQVLVTGGTSGPGFNDITSPVYEAELWNPATESWSTMARESVVRTYHSTAILLPDARVLSSGSGEGGGVAYANSQFSAQIFSPPYLFAADGTLAPRPVINSAPTTLSYGQSFTLGTPDAGSVAKVTLIRLSSVTHAFNQSQLINRLTFSPAGSTTLNATGPKDAKVAPPGPYMLFLINAQGVPSMAKIVSVGP